MSMDRRGFLGLLAGATAGAIFVPKYERWFRPIRVSSAGTLYVAPWGSDWDGRGTRFDPYATVSRALRGFGLGQHRTVNVAAGKYAERIVVPDASSLVLHTSPAGDTVFTGAEPGKPVITLGAMSYMEAPHRFEIRPNSSPAIYVRARAGSQESREDAPR